MRRTSIICICMICFLLIMPVALPAYSAPATAEGSNPPGLPKHFWLGATALLGDTWMPSTGVPWDSRYSYLSLGVNTGKNGMSRWSTEWQEQEAPPGTYVTRYLQESKARGYIPVFTYYNLMESLPGAPGGDAEKDWANVNNYSTMYSYYSDFKLLMKLLAGYSGPVIVHVEPDFWGIMHSKANNPNDLSAAVTSSGFPDIAGYPNTVAGFAQALIHLRNTYAPNVLLAYHVSLWGPGFDVGSDPFAIDTIARADAWADFFKASGPGWDLIFTDFLDGDAAYYQLVRGGRSRWWDPTNTTFPNFKRTADYLQELNRQTGKRIVLWQIPVGNTIMRSMNNSNGHYQDNRVQYFLDSPYANIAQYANAGVIGILFGTGIRDYSTQQLDGRNDGVTNPVPINGNNAVASVADDDGGYLRMKAAAYYAQGAYPLPGTVVLASPVIAQPANTSHTFSMLNWSASTTSPSTVYSLQYNRDTDPTWRTVGKNLSSTSVLFVAPQPGNYKFRVTANDVYGNTSSASETPNYTSMGSDPAGLQKTQLSMIFSGIKLGW